MHSTSWRRRLLTGAMPLGLYLACAWLISADLAIAQPLDDSSATTEFSCSFGMAKGESSRSCHVPFPPGCAVANFPGSTKPWVTISKGGKTTCRFDEKGTDWKTRITGACGRCATGQCSAQFHVRFDCSNR
ncbi:MAG: hypothetical protein ACT4OO_04260 [Nitrospiraceae bacterium]